MTLVDQTDAHANWFEALALWNRIANWIPYRTTEAQLRQQFKSMLIFLWNEKDWLKAEYPAKADQIEQVINASKYMRVVGDLANTVKHRKLTRTRRSRARQTDYYGAVGITGGAERRVHYISLDDGTVEDLMEVVRGALEEFEELRFDLLSGSRTP